MLQRLLTCTAPISILVLSLILLSACSGDADESVPPPSLTVSTAQLRNQSLPQRLPASGSIAAWEEMALGLELAGIRVAAVKADVGDTVRAGQVLLQLDVRTLRMQLLQAQAALDQAEAQLRLAKTNAERGETLRARELIAQGDADELAANHQLALARVLGARAQRDQARLQLEFATLRAPHAGVISQRLVEPGQVIAAGATLFTLIRDGRLEWQAELPEADLLKVRTGMTVEVAGPEGAVSGRVRAVSPALQPRSRTGMLYADLPTPGVLRAGMYAAGEILLGERPQRTLADAAVVERDGYRYVFVLAADGKVSQRRVETGARHGGRIEILSGVEAGEDVVEQGAGFLADGDRVKVVAADGSAPAEVARP